MFYNNKELAGIDCKLVLQVHDELVFEVPESQLETAKTKINTLMTNAFPLKAPLQLNITYGKNWCTRLPPILNSC